MNESELERAKEASRQADELVKTHLDELSLAELMDFSLYRDQIVSDYQAKERVRVRESFGQNKGVVYPRHLKLPGQETKTWWPKVQGLFTKDDGQAMNHSVMGAVSRYITDKADKNPIL